MDAVVGRQPRDSELELLDPTPVAEADEDEVPIEAATRPGMSAGISAAPSPMPDSSSSMLATSGPPKSAEIAEKEPAVERTARSRSPAALPLRWRARSPSRGR